VIPTVGEVPFILAVLSPRVGIGRAVALLMVLAADKRDPRSQSSDARLARASSRP
jgi:hypothetical protein